MILTIFDICRIDQKSTNKANNRIVRKIIKNIFLPDMINAILY